jgi:DinB superfamily
MPLSPTERTDLIVRYERGPALLRAALATVPAAARQWRPGPDKWSAHEVIVHCADSETNAHERLRMLLAEADPVIQGYDQARWARELDYHARPLELALATVAAVRANTVPVLRGLTDAQWARVGRHSESGRYSVEDWARIYGEHLEKHSGQIARNVAAWEEAHR